MSSDVTWNTLPSVEQLLAGAQWKEVPRPPDVAAGELFATHSGKMELLGVEFRVYRLNNGQVVINAIDTEEFVLKNFSGSNE